MIVRDVCGKTLVDAEASSMGELVEEAVRQGVSLKGAVLAPGGSLAGRTLRGVDLRDALMQGVDFTGAVMGEGRFEGATFYRSRLVGVDLRGADLVGADMTDVDLTDADLRGVDLRCSLWSGTRVKGARFDLGGVPVVLGIHMKVWGVASKPGALDMRCTHDPRCRSWEGWVVVLAGAQGRALAARLDSETAAAALIYMASDPSLERIPRFLDASTCEALEEMRWLVEKEER
jgi:hypothetical protein